MKFALPSILIVLLISISCKQPEKSTGNIITEEAKARIDATLKSFIDTNRVAGISALIFEKDKEVYFNAFGLADREANVPMDRNTIVRIYSMTKPVTGVALMQLYEKGLFQLDDPLSKYAPEFANVKVFAGFDDKGAMKLEAPHRAITVRDITRHTAGFLNAGNKDLGEVFRKADLMNKNNTLTQFAEKLSQLPLAFHPGEQWSYGVCVDVQAYLVEKLSGKPFDQYVIENVLNPLKMNNTRYVPTDMKQFAALYNRADGKLNRVADSIAIGFNGQEWSLKPGGFGLTSTVDDYMRFTQMLVNGGKLDDAVILKEETVKLMATNQLSDSVTERMWLPSKGRVGFGIDFAVRLEPAQGPDEKVGAVGEFFWDGAASTLFWVDPKNDLTAVLFLQIFPFDNPVHKEFKDAVYGKYGTTTP
ncbi:serine hydrolase domain-containing protein [Chryseolinea sp. T2]|uniref:serine hydrolase domain-containing protein n=1 Tax=Chryseolinea sp. T2 TaxID=3129255 RepID=UPI003076D766